MTAGVPVFAGLEPDPALQREPGTGNQNREPARSPEPGTGTGNHAGTGPVPENHGSEHGHGSETVPGSEPGTGRAQFSTALVPVTRISLAERLILTIRARIAQVIEDQRRHRTFLHWIWSSFYSAPPDTLESQWRHLRSQSWLQPYMTGKLRSFCKWEGIIYNLVIAMTVTAICQSIEKITQRQWRFWATLLLIGMAILIRIITR